MKQEIKKRFPDGIPLLNPKTDMNINEKAFTEVVNSIEAYETRLYSHPLHKSDQLEEVYAKYNEKVKVSFMIFCFYNMNVCVCAVSYTHLDVYKRQSVLYLTVFMPFSFLLLEILALSFATTR